MQWETVIGLEVHVQLATRSKIFSGAATRFGAPPNTQACAVDLAMPGMLPVLNEDAVRYAVLFGLAVHATGPCKREFVSVCGRCSKVCRWVCPVRAVPLFGALSSHWMTISPLRHSSSPWPPLMWSFPSPPSMKSSPPWPTRLSFPGPPKIVS